MHCKTKTCCVVSGKSTLSYFTALFSEQREARQLHTRFPKQLKRAVLAAVQFRESRSAKRSRRTLGIQGVSLNVRADRSQRSKASSKRWPTKSTSAFLTASSTVKVRLLGTIMRSPDENIEVFVDVQGDKYLARIVKTFPPRTLSTGTTSSPSRSLGSLPHPPGPLYHSLATDLNLSNEELQKKDDAMRYIYNVRLIEEGVAEGVALDQTAATVEHDGNGEKWEGSVMEIQADKIS